MANHLSTTSPGRFGFRRKADFKVIKTTWALGSSGPCSALPIHATNQYFDRSCASARMWLPDTN